MFDMSKLGAVRQQVAEIKSRRMAMATALVPKEEAYPRLDTAIEAVATRFAPNVMPLLRPDWPSPGYAAIGSIVERDIEAVLHALAGKELRALCMREIDRAYATEGAGLPTAQRAAELEKLDRAILALEREEEALIEAAEAAGLEIDRRPDATPAVVLGLEAEAA